MPEGSDDDSPYWEEFLPGEMVSLAGALPEAQRFDAIVIDEAQDFAQSWWPAVLAALRSPMTAASTSSPTRGSGSSPGRAGRRST